MVSRELCKLDGQSPSHAGPERDATIAYPPAGMHPEPSGPMQPVSLPRAVSALRRDRAEGRLTED